MSSPVIVMFRPPEMSRFASATQMEETQMQQLVLHGDEMQELADLESFAEARMTREQEATHAKLWNRDDWEQHTAQNGKAFWHNPVTNRSVWADPSKVAAWKSAAKPFQPSMKLSEAVGRRR